MAFPTGWPPRFPSGLRTLRFYQTGTTSGTYADNAYLFNTTTGNPFFPLPYVAPGSVAPVHFGDLTSSGSPSGASTGNQVHSAESDPVVTFATPPTTVPVSAPDPTAQVWCRAIVIHNTGSGDLVFSFDGTNDMGFVKAGTSSIYFDRYEAGIALKEAAMASTTFIVEAW